MKAPALLLEEMERRNLLVVPLDRHREWYRYHHLLRHMLRRELDRNEPESIEGMHVRRRLLVRTKRPARGGNEARPRGRRSQTRWLAWFSTSPSRCGPAAGSTR